MVRPGMKVFGCFDRAYLTRLAVLAIASILVVFWAKQFERESPMRLALICLECVLVGLTIVLTVSSIRRLDELGQRIHLIGIAVSFTLTAVLGTALGLLQNVGVKVAGWEAWLWPFMAIVWSMSVLVIRRRYS